MIDDKSNPPEVSLQPFVRSPKQLQKASAPAPSESKPPLDYLLEASRTSLNGFLLNQLNKSANARSEMKDVMEEWIEARALALLAEWFLEYGDQLVELAANIVVEQPKEQAGGTRKANGPNRPVSARK